MKKTLLAAAAVVTMGLSSSAFAVPLYVVDDFTSSPPNPFAVTLNCPAGNCAGVQASDGPDSYTIAGNAFTRSVLFEAQEDPLDDINPELNSFAKLRISSGTLRIANDAFVKSRTTLTYDVSSLDGLISENGSTDFNVIFSDGVAGANSTSIQAFLNNISLGTWTLQQAIPGMDPPAFAGFAFNGSMLSGNGDIFRLVINGPAGYDLTIDRIAVDVPEPAMIGLFGLGALGLGLARRRKK